MRHLFMIVLVLAIGGAAQAGEISASKRLCPAFRLWQSHVLMEYGVTTCSLQTYPRTFPLAVKNRARLEHFIIANSSETRASMAKRAKVVELTVDQAAKIGGCKDQRFLHLFAMGAWWVMEPEFQVEIDKFLAGKKNHLMNFCPTGN